MAFAFSSSDMPSLMKDRFQASRLETSSTLSERTLTWETMPGLAEGTLVWASARCGWRTHPARRVQWIRRMRGIVGGASESHECTTTDCRDYTDEFSGWI